MPASQIERELRGNVGFRMFHAFLWAGTRKYHSREVGFRTPDELSTLLDDLEDFPAAFGVLTEAYQAAQPVPQTNDEAEAEDNVEEISPKDKKKAS